MSISEKEMKLLMNFVKDDLKEARESEDIEKKNSKIDRVLEHIQQYRLSIKIKWQDGGGSNGKQKENGKADR